MQKFTNKLEMPWILEDNTHNNYFCFSVIVHIGGYALGGHYITVVYDGTENYYIYKSLFIITRQVNNIMGLYI